MFLVIFPSGPRGYQKGARDLKSFRHFSVKESSKIPYHLQMIGDPFFEN